VTIDTIGGPTSSIKTPTDDGLSKEIQKKGASEIDQEKLLSELLKSLESYEGTGGKGVDPRPGPKGAPALEMPKGDFSADQLSLLLAALSNKNSESQLKTAKVGLNASLKDKNEMHKKAIEKIQEAAKAAQEAVEKEKAGKIMGWIGKIAAFVAAVVATVVAVVMTVASMGAAAPLLAIAVMGLVATGMDLANHISQNMDPPGPDLTISGLMTKAATAILTKVFKMSDDEAKKFAPILAAVMMGPAAAILAPDLIGNAAAAIAVAAGMDPKDAQWIAMAVTLVVTIAVAVAMFVMTAGVGSFDGLAKSAQILGRIADAGGKVLTGATSIATGINKIDVASSEKTAEEARASKKEIDALIKKIAAQMEDEQQRIKEVLQNLDEAMTMVSQMIASAGDTRLQQAKNIV